MSRTLEVFCVSYLCGRKESHSFFIVVFLCIITVAYFMFCYRSFMWIYRNFPSCCWRLSTDFVRTAFVVGKEGCDCCPKVIHTGVSQSLYSKDYRYLVGCILCSKVPLFWFGYDWFYFIAYRRAVNYYEVLGVKSNASLEEIKNAFFEKSKKVRSLFPIIHSTF